MGLVVLSGAGMAVASIPDQGGVIHARYNTAFGSLRVVDDPATCKAVETAIAWNRVGPQGPAGPIGPAGATGLPGPAGPAGATGVAYNGKQASGTEAHLLSNPPGSSTTVVSVDVPAGSYAISAKATLINRDTHNNQATVDCLLSTGDESSVVLPPLALDSALPRFAAQAIALQDVATFSAPTTITVDCRSYAWDVVALHGAITAVQVTSVRSASVAPSR